MSVVRGLSDVNCEADCIFLRCLKLTLSNLYSLIKVIGIFKVMKFLFVGKMGLDLAVLCHGAHYRFRGERDLSR